MFMKAVLLVLIFASAAWAEDIKRTPQQVFAPSNPNQPGTGNGSSGGNNNGGFGTSGATYVGVDLAAQNGVGGNQGRGGNRRARRGATYLGVNMAGAGIRGVTQPSYPQRPLP